MDQKKVCQIISFTSKNIFFLRVNWFISEVNIGLELTEEKKNKGNNSELIGKYNEKNIQLAIVISRILNPNSLPWALNLG